MEKYPCVRINTKKKRKKLSPSYGPAIIRSVNRADGWPTPQNRMYVWTLCSSNSQYLLLAPPPPIPVNSPLETNLLVAVGDVETERQQYGQLEPPCEAGFHSLSKTLAKQ